MQHHPTWGIPRDRNHILSHGQLQPNNRTDPGRNWPWHAFIARVREICGDNPPPPCDHTGGPFTFSCDGAQAGQQCVQLNEPSDPDTWTDNFLCTVNDYGFRWSNAGPIDGMDCTGVHEGAEPLASVWGVAAAGLLDVEVEGGRRRQGLAHFLLADALQDLSREGVTLVETHASRSNVAALMLFSKLGFEAVEHGTLFRKP